MSRIGKKPIPVPAGVKVNVAANRAVTVEGKLGKLEYTHRPEITVKVDGSTVVCSRDSEEREVRAYHGLTRALINNMLIGVAEGYEKKLEIQGVGYKAEMKGKNLVLSVGYANTVDMAIPTGVTVTLEGTTKIHVAGPDKQAVGQFAAEVRKIRKPEPYKGKGIRYDGEKVKIKPGKAFAGAGAAK